MGKNIWEKGIDAVKNNWEYVAAGATVVAGGVLIATGVGGPAGVALISGGISVASQKAPNGKVSLLQTGMDLLPVGRLVGVARKVAGPAIRAAGPLLGKGKAALDKLNPSGLVKKLFERGARQPDHLTPIGPAPENASRVFDHVSVKGSPPPGYKGGRTFQNNGNGMLLPRSNMVRSPIASGTSTLTSRESIAGPNDS